MRKETSNSTLFFCSSCGVESAKWQGKCTSCGEWNTFQEAPKVKPGARNSKSSSLDPATRARSGASALDAVSLTNVTKSEFPRVFTGLAELDRVLGGGCVPGSLILLSGDPGVGKSTLVMQTLKGLAYQGYKALYASGEENPHQLLLRAERLQAVHESILVTQETTLERIFEMCEQKKPRFLVVDSIQTIASEEFPSSPGSVLQVRECSARLMMYCKENQVTCFVIGQVTKEGHVAGPKLLEHLVDTVLYIEGDSSMGYRLLRAVKNRFGSTGEIGVFEMTAKGLEDVSNPSALFMGSENQAPASGSAVSVAVEGTRPFVLEMQVLAGSATYASPRRIVSGLDGNRLAILVAVLEKRGGMNFSSNDVYASVAGGLKVTESAHDLALVSALISSRRDKAPPSRTCYFGEVSLGGDVRPVPHAVARVKEARQRGFERVFLPMACYMKEKSEILAIAKASEQEMQIYPIRNVGELMQQIGI